MAKSRSEESKSESQSQSQDVSEQTGRELEALRSIPPATREDMNPFEVFGATSSRGNVAGRLLRFSKGDYFLENEEVPLGSKYVAVMEDTMIGWVKWEEGRPAEQLMHKLFENPHVASRASLGDEDESGWPELSGRPIDPWQETYYLVLKDVGKSLEDENLYTLPVNSGGGRDNAKRLFTAYGRAMRQRPDEWPVVELQVESYLHPDFGRIKKPVFKIVDWERKPQTRIAA